MVPIRKFYKDDLGKGNGLDQKKEIDEENNRYIYRQFLQRTVWKITKPDLPRVT